MGRVYLPPSESNLEMALSRDIVKKEEKKPRAGALSPKADWVQITNDKKPWPDWRAVYYGMNCAVWLIGHRQLWKYLARLPGGKAEIFVGYGISRREAMCCLEARIEQLAHGT